MCFVVEPANPVNDCTCIHQGNFEPSHIAQTENAKSSSILAHVDLDARSRRKFTNGPGRAWATFELG